MDYPVLLLYKQASVNCKVQQRITCPICSNKSMSTSLHACVYDDINQKCILSAVKCLSIDFLQKSYRH